LPVEKVVDQRPAVGIPLARFAPGSPKRPVDIEHEIDVPFRMVREKKTGRSRATVKKAVKKVGVGHKRVERRLSR
jgi:hypothetical protein